MRLPALGLAFVVAVAACSTDVTGGQLVRSQVGDLVLEGSVGRSVLGVGDTTSVVFRLRNAGAARLDLVFTRSCQVVPFITTRDPADFVYPGGGWWGCAAVMTPLALEPGAEFVTTVLVRGGVSGPGVPLPVGQYLAYARVEHPSFPLQSEPLAILVR